MKRGAPPYNVGSPEHLFPTEFHGLKAELICKRYQSFVHGIISIFRDGMDPSKLVCLSDNNMQIL